MSLYDTRSTDDNGELLCSLPAPALPFSMPRATVPIMDFSDEALEACRQAKARLAAREMAAEYSQHVTQTSP